tara:strand:- start:1621 stop:2262 length:642 start_codon:yes stop_codon:yes gene_type:complete
MEIIKQIDEILLNTKFEIEFILVNNGSTDNSKNILEKLINDNRQIKLINIENNIGYGSGILSGLKIANGDVLSWTHADLQTDFFDVIRAYNKYQSENNPDLIIKGKRKNRNFIDAFFTWGMQRYTGIKLKVKLNDINAQPKLFSKSFYKKHLSLAPVDFSLDLFLLIKAKQFGMIKTIDVIFQKRKHGEAKGGGSIKGKFKLIKRTINYINNY